MSRPSSRAFTLIELMIVVGVIGILTSVALPAFKRMQCKAKQTEARSLLRGIYTTQALYHSEFDRFVTLAALTTYAGLDRKSLTGSKFYDVSDAIVFSNYYFFVAVDSKTPLDSTGPDVWRLYSDADGTLENHPNTCGN